MSNVHLNEKTKQSIRKGIERYINSLHHVDTNSQMHVITESNEIPATIKISAHRRRDVVQLLSLVNQVHFSNQELEEQARAYLKKIKTGVFGRSKLRQFVDGELKQIDTLHMDRQLLRDHQVLKNSDSQQEIDRLKVQLTKAIGNFENARKVAFHWKQKVEQLELMFNQMEEIDKEYKKAQEALKSELALLRSKLNARKLNGGSGLQKSDPSSSRESAHQSSAKKGFNVDKKSDVVSDASAASVRPWKTGAI